MKKIVFILIGFMFSVQLYSQPCTPDNNITSPGIYPDVLTNLPPATIGVYYETVMSTMIPTDTTYMTFNATIDSIGVKKITGLPTGIDWITDSQTNYWNAGQKGCLKISGIPQTEGTYNLEVILDIHGKLGGMPLALLDTVKDYKIIVGPAGIQQRENLSFSVLKVYPNPVSDVLNFSISANKAEQLELVIQNILGSTLSKFDIVLKQGDNTISIQLTEKQKGLYFYKFTGNSYSITQKFIISD